MATMTAWTDLSDELDRRLRQLTPPGPAGLMKFRVRRDPRSRAEGRRLVRDYEARAAGLCLACGGSGRVREGAIVTVVCDDCV